jgi:ribokinase
MWERNEMSKANVTVMGIFALDLAFRSPRLPVWGETVVGSGLQMGPGGKGSNQAVGAARLGAQTTFLSKIGADAFGEIALKTYRDAGVQTDFLVRAEGEATGAAAILVQEDSGENAIVVCPAAAEKLTTQEIDRAAERIADSACFLTQFELPMALVEHGIALARDKGVKTILNPAPGLACSDSLLALCDYVTPNEGETEALTGMRVSTLEEAEAAAGELLRRGAGHAVITLGGQGVLVRSATITQHIAAFEAGPVVDTTGAGDAFNAGFAVALAEGMDLVEAARFGCAVAGISVTRHGTSHSMPRREEVEALLAK